MSDNKTMDYYNKNANQYFENTVSVDMSEMCDRFLGYVKPQGRIIDIGAGSGRDMKYFKDRGFDICGIDASEEMSRLASDYADTPVECVKIQDWNPKMRYDGVWANASLVHLTESEIKSFIEKLPGVLNDGGVAYISLKSGIETGEDSEGRYFTNISEDWITDVVAENRTLSLLEIWETGDKLNRSEIRWVNVILRLK